MNRDNDSGVIAPASFTPMDPGKQGPQRRISPLQIGVVAILLLFALAFWFLFSARSVLIAVQPDSGDVDISGGLHLQLGDRHLLRPGEFSLEVSAAGHYPQQHSFTVTRDAQQSFSFSLERLPGLLNIDTVPSGARVLIDDVDIGVTALTQQEVAAGDHELSLLAPRYLPLKQTIEVVGMQQQQDFLLELEPAWAEVTVSSTPAGASILVDGEAVATTPAVVEVLRGEHPLSLELAGFKTWETELAIEAGVAQLLPDVVLEPADGLLQLSSTPAAASVTVNGEYRGQTPLALELEPGREHRIAVFKAGYTSTNRMLSLAAGSEESLNVTLAAQLGEVTVRVSPPGAEIRIGGKSYGSGNRSLRLPAFEQQLEVSLAGYRSYWQRFTPRPGLSQLITVELLTEDAARLADLKPTYTTSAGQQMRLFMPATEFTMGASRREPGRRANEVLHPVSLSRMFYASVHEVTNAQFRQFRSEHNSGRVEGNSLNRDKQPVVMVSWNDAALYCNWLSQRAKLAPVYKVSAGKVTGFDSNATGYRMLTEAEWAWLARSRGEDLLKYAWGDQFPPADKVGNYADRSSAYITGRTVQGYSDGQVVSSPVGSFPANHNGLYDIGGNVAEWVHDFYEIPGSGGAVRADPMGKASGTNHVIRGASWTHGTVTELRLSFRDYGQAARDDVGFRIARFAEQR